jgi:Transcriptional regulator, AbiEi antitoxin, Type IV TA system
MIERRDPLDGLIHEYGLRSVIGISAPAGFDVSRWPDSLFTIYAIFTAAMKMAGSINIPPGPTGYVLELVRRIPGLEDAAAEADLLSLRESGPAVRVEFRQRVRTPEAWSVIRGRDELDEISLPPLLLVAEDSTEDARRLLDAHGIGIVDARGRARIRFPGLVVHVERRERDGKRGAVASGRRLAGRAAVAAQALLLEPEREWTVAGLARASEVSTALAHYVLARMEKEGIAQSRGSGPRKVRVLSNPSALLDLWAEEAHDRGVRGLSCYRFAATSRALTEDVSRALAGADVGHAVTGAAAADLLAPFLSAISAVSLWVGARHPLGEVARLLDAEPVERGANLMLRQARDDSPLAFTEQHRGVWLANRFRVYVDLRSDPRRGVEQADHLRSEAIGF